MCVCVLDCVVLMQDCELTGELEIMYIESNSCVCKNIYILEAEHTLILSILVSIPKKVLKLLELHLT